MSEIQVCLQVDEVSIEKNGVVATVVILKYRHGFNVLNNEMPLSWTMKLLVWFIEMGKMLWESLLANQQNGMGYIDVFFTVQTKWKLAELSTTVFTLKSLGVLVWNSQVWRNKNSV